MKVGLDVHGVIDRYPVLFQRLSKDLIQAGHEVAIITGQEWEKIVPKIEALDICYTSHFSIVDYHKSIGTRMHQDEKGTWWMGNIAWVRSKGDYIHREHIDIHFDDSCEYANWVPEFCSFILVPNTGFEIYFAEMARLFPRE